MTRPGAAAVVAVLALAAPSHAAAPATGPACEVLSADRGVANPAVYCLSYAADDTVLLHRWSGGKWTTTKTGVPADADNRAMQVWPAPGGVVFSTGGNVYVRAGQSAFTLLYQDDRSIGVPGADVTPYVGPEPAQVTPFSVARAQAATVGATVYTTAGLRREVLGAPTWTTHFIVPPDYATRRTAIAIGTNPSTKLNELSAFACTGDLTCLDHRARLSDGYPQEGFFLDPAKGTAYVEILAGWRSRHWRTDDFGITWRPWSSLDKIVDGLKAEIVHGAVRARPGRPSEMYARFVARSPAKGTPDEIWSRSTDSGATWRVIGRGYAARRGHGTLPYVPSAAAAVEAQFEMLPDGTLMVGTGPSPRVQRWRYDGGRLRR